MKIAGVDEVGIGCLAGPLISAAVIFGKNKSEYFFKDSKKTTQKNRAVQASYIKSNFYVGIGVASPSEIDELNVLRASSSVIFDFLIIQDINLGSFHRFKSISNESWFGNMRGRFSVIPPPVMWLNPDINLLEIKGASIL